MKLGQVQAPLDGATKPAVLTRGTGVLPGGQAAQGTYASQRVSGRSARYLKEVQGPPVWRQLGGGGTFRTHVCLAAVLVLSARACAVSRRTGKAGPGDSAAGREVP